MKVRHPQHKRDVIHDAVIYRPDESGVVDVPQPAVGPLLSAGYQHVQEIDTLADVGESTAGEGSAVPDDAAVDTVAADAANAGTTDKAKPSKK